MHFVFMIFYLYNYYFIIHFPLKTIKNCKVANINLKYNYINLKGMVNIEN